MKTMIPYRYQLHLMLLLIVVPVFVSTFITGCLKDREQSQFLQSVIETESGYLADRFLQQVESIPSDSARQQFVQEFMEYLQYNDNLGVPLTEDSLVTFYFVYQTPVPPVIACDLSGWEITDEFTMLPLPGTNLWYLRKFLPPDSRMDYKIVVGESWIFDPLNPRQVTGGYATNSELVMPDFVDPVEIRTDPTIDHGIVLEMPIESAVYGETRNTTLYFPPGYSEDHEPYPVLYVLDGSDYLQYGHMKNILDYCIAHEICEPMTAVFTNPVDRMTEYWRDETFEEFFINELLPFSESQLNISEDPSEKLVMGASLGGVSSLYLVLNNSSRIANAAGQSSSLWIEDAITVHEFSERQMENIHLYLSMGTFEGEENLALSRELQEILLQNGYNYQYREFHDGHSFGNWRTHIDEILFCFFPGTHTDREDVLE